MGGDRQSYMGGLPGVHGPLGEMEEKCEGVRKGWKEYSAGISGCIRPGWKTQKMGELPMPGLLQDGVVDSLFLCKCWIL